MKDRRTLRPMTFIADAVTGLAIFLLTAGLLTSSCDGRGVRLSDIMAEAHAAKFDMAGTASTWAQQTSQTLPLAMVTTYPGQVFRNTDRTTAFLVLGAVFTLLFAANIALYRHLRSNYSRPRRRNQKRASAL